MDDVVRMALAADRVAERRGWSPLWAIDNTLRYFSIPVTTTSRRRLLMACAEAIA